MPCSPVDVLQPFGGKYCLYVHGRKLRQGNQQEPNITLFRKIAEL
jgi:hypothetical protein